MSIQAPTSIHVSAGMSQALETTRIRDIAALRWILQDKDVQEFADHHGIKPSTVREAAKRVGQLLYYRARDRSGLTQYPQTLKVLTDNPAFWLEKLVANEDRLRVLDNSKLPQ